jgi:hypothetical protein
MGQYVVKDSAGVGHIIWRQELNASCGPACCFMVVCMVNRMSMAGGETFMRNLAMKYGASIFDLLVNPGTNGSQLRAILTGNGIKLDPRWKVEGEHWSLALSASEEKPMILFVQWSDGGGHWVVCAGSNQYGAIILDPIYGLSEVPLSTLPAYNPQAKGQSVVGNNRFSGYFIRVV